ncbi:PspC domain-containing protein [Aquipuribacter hungaricus]|uniref:Sensor histidine kinase n=1 Tax=Aquipuribacter hungaricus TaxID=545624 RepID=A0ABV7WGT6_9MICO
MVPAVRPPLRRREAGRVVAGVAAGLAAHLGAPVRTVRIVAVCAGFAMGVGVVAYLLLWLVLPVDGPAGTRAGGPAGDGTPATGTRAPLRVDGETGSWLLWGVVLTVLGGAALVQRAGVGVPVPTLLAGTVAVTGAVIAWTHLDTGDRRRWVSGATGGTPRGALRLVLGLGLAATGLLLLALTGSEASVLRPAALATMAVLGGLGLLLAPWALRLWRGLEAERAARVRETERADIAAHLHDSVLQTLALIQRRSDDPAEVARLARAQERELRGWLYGSRAAQARGALPGSQVAEPLSLAAAVERAVAQVEDTHAVPVEVVVVGDRATDARTDALVLALREAATNAVRHARPPVRVYVEVADDAVQAYVSDRGDGFDVDAVPEDRLGVRESVLGRMRRAGGSARVRRPAAGGTEVVLELPVLAPVPQQPVQHPVQHPHEQEAR